LVWSKKSLGEILNLKRGYDLPTSQRLQGTVPVVSSSGITGTHKEAKVQGPGVVTGRYGTLGEVFYISEDFWPLNTALYVQDFKGSNPRFIAFFLKQFLSGTSSDKAAVPGVNRNDLHAKQVLFPDVETQEKIADVLSAYDDLIENNRRRIQLLEQSARLLYKEWFVRLRFPGHEHVKIKDGVPVGWKKEKLSDLANITMGQSPASTFYNQNGIGLPFHQGVTNFGDRFPENLTYCSKEFRIAEPGDILFSVRAPVGRINVTSNRIVIGRGLAAINSKRKHQSFLFYQLKNHFFKEDMIGGGAIFAAITKKDLYGVELFMPPDALIGFFENQACPIDSQIESLHKGIILLTKARDILLPRLMNGEIEV
jgi:type I restriction enzyme S subunit